MHSISRIRALVFDFDGLIVDTETPEFLAWQQIFAAHACELPLQTWGLNIGTHGMLDIYAFLAERSGQPVDREKIRQERRALYQAAIAEQRLLPGVLEYLEAARAAGLGLAVASSSRHDWVDSHLRQHGIWDYFDAVVCADDVACVKPDPELYQLALARLGVRPEDAVALEDSPNGVAAAKAAGMFCVFVPNSITVHLSTDLADLQLASLTELPLAQLLARLTAQ